MTTPSAAPTPTTQDWLREKAQTFNLAAAREELGIRTTLQAAAENRAEAAEARLREAFDNH